MPATRPIRVLSPRAGAPATSLEDTVIAIMTDLQHACAELLARAPGSINRPVDLERALKVDKKLAWQVFRLARAAQPIAEVANVPPGVSMRRLLAAAGRAKVPRAVVEAVSEAFALFETFVSEHGGDRAEVTSMIGGLGLEGGDESRLKERKLLFRANANAWGVQVETFVRSAVIHQGHPAPERTDDVFLMTGYVGLQRMRRGTPIAINAHLRTYDDPASAGGAGQDERQKHAVSEPPAQKRVRTMQALPEFSSHPLPEMVPRVDPSGAVETELVFSASGRAGAITLYASQHTVAASKGEQSQYGLNSIVNIPVATFVNEVLVPSGWTDPGTARIGVYGRRGAVDRVYECRSIDLLPQRETITYMGSLEGSPPIPGVPQHSEAVRHMLRQLGWDGTRFDVYRCTVQYPVLHTMVRIAVDTGKK